MTETTHFGYKQVKQSEKEALVGGVFSSVAAKYDIMNDVMSFGIHRLWKDQMIKVLNPKDGSHLIDMAGGTGDIAFRYLKLAPKARVTVCDINRQMLEEGKKNAVNKNILNNIGWQCCNAQSLPFDDNCFDYYTIAFGIRNVTDINAALKEANRVLKPGGKFVCLEFSHVENDIMKRIYELYSFKAIPYFGQIITKDSDSYKYLVESIRKFPQADEFLDMINNAGFSHSKYTTLSVGIVAIHSGWKVF